MFDRWISPTQNPLYDGLAHYSLEGAESHCEGTFTILDTSCYYLGRSVTFVASVAAVPAELICEILSLIGIIFLVLEAKLVTLSDDSLIKTLILVPIVIPVVLNQWLFVPLIIQLAQDIGIILDTENLAHSLGLSAEEDDLQFCPLGSALLSNITSGEFFNDFNRLMPLALHSLYYGLVHYPLKEAEIHCQGDFSIADTGCYYVGRTITFVVSVPALPLELVCETLLAITEIFIRSLRLVNISEDSFIAPLLTGPAYVPAFANYYLFVPLVTNLAQDTGIVHWNKNLAQFFGYDRDDEKMEFFPFITALGIEI